MTDMRQVRVIGGQGGLLKVVLVGMWLCASGGVEAAVQDVRDPAVGLGGSDETAEYLESTDRVEVYGGIDVVSQYVSRGIVFSNKVNYQPWVEVHLPVLDLESVPALSSPRVFVGNWNSFSGGDPGLGQQNTGRFRYWYESDLYGGASVVVGELLFASVRYNYYTSPSSSWDDVHEIDGRLRLDDSWYWQEYWGFDDFATYPALRATHELDVGESPRRGAYVQLSATPTVTLDEPAVTLEVPLAVGLGGGGQFTDADGKSKRLGFLRTGVGASAPLEVLPAGAGELRIRAAVDWYLLDDSAFSGTDDDELVVGTVGLSYSF